MVKGYIFSLLCFFSCIFDWQLERITKKNHLVKVKQQKRLWVSENMQYWLLVCVNLHIYILYISIQLQYLTFTLLHAFTLNLIKLDWLELIACAN